MKNNEWTLDLQAYVDGELEPSRRAEVEQVLAGDAEARELVAAPSHPYTRALVAAVPRSDGRPRDMSVMPSGEAPDASAIPAGCRFHPRCPLVVSGEAERLGIVDK